MSLEGYNIPAEQLVRPDPSSFSNHQFAQTTNFHVDFIADLDACTIKTVYDVRVLINQDGAVVASLDISKIALESVEQISAIQGNVINTNVKYAFAEVCPKGEGQRFLLGLPQDKPHKAGDELFFRFKYTLNDQASACQYLTKEQTSSDHPFFYTQCQACHARSLLPIQDACFCKLTFTASVTVKKPLTAIMSAHKDAETIDNQDGTQTYFFRQSQRIPPYLFAIAIADTVERITGPRTTVIAQPHEIEVAYKEYAEMDNILNTLETIAGPYPWKNSYKILSMPAAFPFGGMEGVVTFNSGSLLPLPRHKLSNPKCLYCPSAEEKALGLAALVGVHECAHNWAGNDATCTTWSCFFLNEGLCMFLQLRAMQKLYGHEEEALQRLIDWTDLKDSVDFFLEQGDENATKLVTDLSNAAVDDIFSGVPYHKGSAFFFYLETIMGGPERFEAFLKVFFKAFEFGSVDHNTFKALYLDFANKHGFTERLAEIDWDTWFFAPGLPPHKPEVLMTLATPAYDLAINIADESKPEYDYNHVALTQWSAQQQTVFLDKLIEIIDEKNTKVENRASFQLFFREFTIPTITKLVNFAESRNCELLSRWLHILIKAGVPKETIICQQDGKDLSIEAIITWFLENIGRMKFNRPLFRLMMKSTVYNTFGAELYPKVRHQYHTTAQDMINKDFAATAAKPSFLC